MITKVSYSAYASSANLMQRQNQSKDVNFGMLGFGNSAKTATELRDFARSFMPLHMYHKAPTSIFGNPQDGARLGALVDFLEACALAPQAKGQSLVEEVLCRLTLNQPKPTPVKITARAKALHEIAMFCDRHQDLTADKIFDGATKEVSLEMIKEHLTSMQVIEARLAEGNKK